MHFKQENLATGLVEFYRANTSSSFSYGINGSTANVSSVGRITLSNVNVSHKQVHLHMVTYNNQMGFYMLQTVVQILVQIK